eukprot:gnl/TRDRNA2_/TRDRNA2_174485_c1_seq1.p1 gnl/TRDRNA2_/TRDRNA2_174485_c1~~gnl/TRDRNA2_/TRDRNA2_174485_c1_seq1.p1  ORF type:complete len:790 (+),score=171.60 gnl/TRDRNA2_/TRDRNA2_174485_c1_seq1:95-2464(+)
MMKALTFAGAVLVTTASATGKIQVVLDDAKATHVGSTKWQTGAYDACAAGAHDGSFHHDGAANKGSVKVEYTFDPPVDGCYLVEEWHPTQTQKVDNDECSKLMPTEVRIDVDYCKGMSTYTYLDYSVGGGMWNKLGRLPFFVGHQGKFVSTNEGTASNCAAGEGCLWVADAWRLTLDETLDANCNPLKPEVTEEQAVEAAEASHATMKGDEHLSGGVLEDLKIAEEVLAGLDEHSRIVVDDREAAIDNSAWMAHEHGQKNTELQCRGESAWKERFLFSNTKRAGNSGEHAVFPFKPPMDGCYLVEEFHPASTCNASPTSRARLSVHYCKGLVHDVAVNQAARGNKWNFVALLPFYQGHTGGVAVSTHGADGEFVVADAFRFTRVAEGRCDSAPIQLQQYQRMITNSPVSIVLDDRAAMKSGPSSSSVCDATALLGSAHTVAEGQAAAEFAFEPPSTGCYRVDEYHPKATESCNLAHTGDVRVDYCYGKNWEGKVALAQRGAQWNTLGHFPFFAGVPGKVTSRRLAETPAGRHWAADAFRLTKVSDSCFEVPHAALVGLRIVGAEIEAPEVANGLTTHVDLRHALHQAVAKVAGVRHDYVRLLGARRGSIITDFELLGQSHADVSAAVANIEKALQGSSMPAALCAATRAGPECKVELVHKAVITPPRGDEARSLWEENADTMQTVVIVATCIASFIIGLVVATYGYLGFARRRRQQQAAEPKEQEPTAVITAVVPKKDDMDEKASVGSASTKTPSEQGDKDTKSDIEACSDPATPDDDQVSQPSIVRVQ